MAKSTRPTKSVNKRTSKQYSLGGTLLALLILLLSWWLGGGTSTTEVASPRADSAPVSAVTVLSTLAAPPEKTTGAESASVATTEDTATAEATAAIATAVATDPARAATQAPTARPSSTPQRSSGPAGMASITLDQLPPEAVETLALIEQDGPFPFSRDGITFQNREGFLPQKARGYYREYTVITPGESDRGARRIIAGENGEFYYTADHYASFAWIATP